MKAGIGGAKLHDDIEEEKDDKSDYYMDDDDDQVDDISPAKVQSLNGAGEKITVASAKQDSITPLQTESPLKINQSASKDDSSFIRKEMKGSSDWVVAAPTSSNRASLLKM